MLTHILKVQLILVAVLASVVSFGEFVTYVNTPDLAPANIVMLTHDGAEESAITKELVIQKTPLAIKRIANKIIEYYSPAREKFASAQVKVEEKRGVVLGATSSLTQSQIDSIISLLQAFGADALTIANVQTALDPVQYPASAGQLLVSEDTSVPLKYRLVQAGSAGVTFARLKFHATSEAINLSQLSLKLTNTASSSPADFINNQVRLYKDDGVTQVGTITFSGMVGRASTTIFDFTVPANGDAYMIVKGDLSQIGNVYLGVQGHLIAVDYFNDNNGGTSSTGGVGLLSGMAIKSSSQSTKVAPVRVFSSVPTIGDATTGSTLMSGVDLYKFTIVAPPAIGSSGSNGVQLSKVTFSVATTSAILSNFQLHGPNGVVNALPANVSYDIQNVQSNSRVVKIFFDSSSTDRFVAPGTSKTYVLRVGGVAYGFGTNSAAIRLLGDVAYPRNGGQGMRWSGDRAFMSDFSSINGDINNHFIWSPQATTTISLNNNDFTNGFGVPVGVGGTLTGGLPTHTFTHEGPVANLPTAPVIGGFYANSTTTPYYVRVNWFDQASNETGFILERSTASTTGFTVINNNLSPYISANPSLVCSTAYPSYPTYPCQSYKDFNVNYGDTFFYRIKAKNQYGESAYSRVISAAVITETIPPTISIQAPVFGNSYATSSSPLGHVNLYVTDNVVVTSVIWSNSITGQSGGAYAGDFSSIHVTPKINLASGENILVFKAYDGSGNSTTATLVVNYASGASVKKVAVIKVTGGDPAYSVFSDADTLEMIEKLKNFYNQASFAKIVLETTIFNYALSSSCPNIRDVISTADPNLNYANYDYVLILNGHTGDCLGRGLAFRDFFDTGEGYRQISYAIADIAYSPGDLEKYKKQKLVNAAHELGHLFGFAHAGYLFCGSESLKRNITDCQKFEYGDTHDVMGHTLDYLPHFNSNHSTKIEVLNPNQAVTVTNPGNYEIVALGANSTNAKVLKIPRGDGTNLWIEYRYPIGLDSVINPDFINGMQVRVDNLGGTDTYVVDGSPGGTINSVINNPGNTKERIDFAIGQSFVDPVSGKIITAYTQSSDHRTLYIRVEELAAEDIIRPTVSITSPAAWTNYFMGQQVSISAMANDAGGISKVEFSDGGALKLTDTAAPYEYMWNIDASVAVGQHAWFATAYDNSGNHTTSDPLFVSVLNSPSITITYPTAGVNIYRAAPSTIVWHSTGIIGNVKIDLLKNNVYYKTISASAVNSGSYTWTPNQIVASTVTGFSNQFKVVITGNSSAGQAIMGTSPSFLITAQTALNYGAPQVAGASSSLTDAQMQAIIALLESFGAEASVVSNVQKSLRGESVVSPSTSDQWCHTFQKNLKIGDHGSEIFALIRALNEEGDSDIELEGKSTSALFSEGVAAAVSAFQEYYNDDILVPAGLSHPTGYVGAATRKKLNELYGCDSRGNENPKPMPMPYVYPKEKPYEYKKPIYTPVPPKNSLDIDRNGSVDGYDSNLLADVIGGIASCPADQKCDVNNDGAVNAFDLLSYYFVNTPFDLTGDGAINGEDNKLLASVIVGSMSCPSGKKCDTNNDGVINIFDLSALNKDTGLLSCVAPSNLSPTGSITASADGKIDLSWSPAEGAAYYAIRLDDGSSDRYDDPRYHTCMPNGTPHYYCENGITGTSINGIPVKPGRTYKYWVDAIFYPLRWGDACRSTTQITVSANTPTTTHLPVLFGDYDGNGDVSTVELQKAIVMGNGSYVPTTAEKLASDTDGDNDVDSVDVDRISDNSFRKQPAFCGLIAGKSSSGIQLAGDFDKNGDISPVELQKSILLKQGAMQATSDEMKIIDSNSNGIIDEHDVQTVTDNSFGIKPMSCVFATGAVLGAWAEAPAMLGFY
ncbi:MAG: Ig-like domain-containing protein [Patescibacteria group bacterium]